MVDRKALKRESLGTDTREATNTDQDEPVEAEDTPSRTRQSTDGREPAPSSNTRRSFIKGIGAALGGVGASRLASPASADNQGYIEGRFSGYYYDELVAAAYVGQGSAAYASGAQAQYEPYTDPNARPTPIEGWHWWADPTQPTQWQIEAPHDWESWGDYFGSLQGVIPAGRNWPLWLFRSLDAGLVYDTPFPVPNAIDTGIAAETQLVVERVDNSLSIQELIESNHQLLQLYDPIYQNQLYPRFFTYYTQTNGEPGAFWVRWQLPPERYWFASDGTDMGIIGPGWNEWQTLVVENWAVRGSTLYVVHADIKLHHDPTVENQGVMRGWRSVTEDVFYRMVTSFTTYTYT